MKDYSEMSDAEISQKVGELISRDGLSVIGASGKACIHHYSEPVGEFGEMCMGWKEFDPCNSWADAGPIIQRHKISLIWVKTEIPNRWDAGSPCHMKWAAHEYNPLRAAMETFLMMQESK